MTPFQCLISLYLHAQTEKHLTGLPLQQQQVGMEQVHKPARDITLACPCFFFFVFFYDAADEHQRTRPAVNPSQRDMARRQDSVLRRISDLWRPPSGIPLTVTCPQYITHTCHFAGVN